MGMSTMLVTKQNAERGECRNSEYKLPLCALSNKKKQIYNFELLNVIQISVINMKCLVLI